MPLKELTVGEDLLIEVGRYKQRTGRDWTVVANACASVEPATRTPYSELLALTELPTKIKPRRRLYVLCLAIGLDPEHYGLTTADRFQFWPADELIREHLANVLATPYAADKKVPYLTLQVRSDRSGPARRDRRGPQHTRPGRTVVSGR